MIDVNDCSYFFENRIAATLNIKNPISINAEIDRPISTPKSPPR